jgi:thermitase
MRTLIYRPLLILVIVIGLIFLWGSVALSGPMAQGDQGNHEEQPIRGPTQGIAPPPLENHPEANPLTSAEGEWPEEAVPNELLVKVRDISRRTELTALHAELGAEVVDEISGLGVQVIRVPKGRAKAALAAYQSDRRVEYAEPNYLVHALDVPNDPNLSQQWAITKIKLPAAWNWTHGDPSVVIAILDTGADFSHPDLQGKFTPGYDFVNNDSIPDDDHGHGTHVSGITAANTNNGIGIAGVCRECQLMPVKVLSSSGSGTHAAIAQGITWAADHGARVINMSLGGFYSSQTLQQAITYAWNRGLVIVAAAGNENTNSPSYPAAYPEVIGVAATDSSDNRASFSNYGSYVSVAAPGVGILSTVRGGGYQSWSGTSMASPHVAGLAGLLFSQDPSRSNATVRQIIEQSADDLGSPGRDDYFGYGRINAERALGGSSVPTSTPPLPTFTPSPTPTRDPCAEGENPTELEQEVIGLINVERQNAGLAPLRTDVRLVEAARLHSQDMAANSFLSHTGSDGSSPWDRIARAGYPMITGGETVGGGYTTAQAIVQGWMDSAPHQAILLNPEFQDIGVGYAYNANSTHRYYWTADFGVSQDGGQPPPTATGTPDCPTRTPTVTPTRTPSVTPSLTPSPSPTLCPNCATLTITPVANAVGWVLSSEATGNHFGDDDIYVGFFGGRIYHGAVQFDLRLIPPGSQVASAWVQLTGQTREYTAPSGGVWNLRLLADNVDANWSLHNYYDIHNAPVLATIPPDVQNAQLDVGVKNIFTFTGGQLQYVNARIAGTRLISFRVDGPDSGVNNVFSWDSGYGEGNTGAPPELHITLAGGTLPTSTPVPPSPTLVPSATRTPSPTRTSIPASATPTSSRTPPPPTATRTNTPVATATRPGGPTILVTVTPAENAVGWVMANEPTGNHFGDDDIYTGVFNGWIHHGALQFDLSMIPADAHVVSARVSLTGQTRQYAGSDGTWRLQLLASAADNGWTNDTYAIIHAAQVLSTVPPLLANTDLDAGKTNTFTFESGQLPLIEQRLSTTRRISFRLDGPDSGVNNVFSWDSGYGQGGLLIKPVLAIEYSSDTPGATNTPVLPATPTWTATSTPRPPTATATPLPVWTIAPTNTPVPPTQTPTGNLIDQAISEINRVRTANGVPALTTDGRLMNASQQHSQDMANHNFFGHTGSDGSTPQDRMLRNGFPLGRGDEIIISNTGVPADMVNAVVGSAQRGVLLDPGYTHLGVGYAYNSSTTYVHYWTLLVANVGTPTPPTATPTPDNSQTVTVDLTPEGNAVGWARQGDSVANHLGDDDVYAGFFAGYTYHGAVQFRLASIPSNATIIDARLDFTGQTREYMQASGGEWNLRLLDPNLDTHWGDVSYDTLHNATVVYTIPPTLQNSELQVGQVNTFAFNSDQLSVLQSRLATGLVSFRLDGPLSGANNIFSWDSGYGTGGLGVKPVLHVTYRSP